jgi:hypothetical protein
MVGFVVMRMKPGRLGVSKYKSGRITSAELNKQWGFNSPNLV